MSLIKKILVSAALAGAMALTALPALAAQTTTTLNVRSGPGTSYGVVDVLRRGETVDVTRRSSGWCQIGRSQWVSCRYLTDGRGSGSGGGIVIGGGDSGVSLGFSIPGFSFFVGDGGVNFDRPRRPGRSDRVCFYEHVRFGGDSFCARPGENIRALGAWNDRISSIRVSGRAEALVCQNNNFRGRCAVIDRSVRDLGRRGNDVISSIRVR